MEIKKDYLKYSESLFRLSLQEDIGDGDKTTEALIASSKQKEARIIAKSNGIISGLEAAERIFKMVSEKVNWESKVDDGDAATEGETIAEISGPFQAILTGERTALNFLQRMSGVATKTKAFADQLKGTKTKLLDTRKTIPGFRYLDKYSVLVGGGINHRFGLFDMILIKENHIKTAGSILKAVENVKKKYHHKYEIEVETRNLDEVNEALEAGVDFIMFDNMSLDEIRNSVNISQGKVKTEASGNVNLDNIREIALTGVDFISVGAITHSVPALDISLLIK